MEEKRHIIFYYFNYSHLQTYSSSSRTILSLFVLIGFLFRLHTIQPHYSSPKFNRGRCWLCKVCSHLRMTATAVNLNVCAMDGGRVVWIVVIALQKRGSSASSIPPLLVSLTTNTITIHSRIYLLVLSCSTEWVSDWLTGGHGHRELLLPISIIIIIIVSLLPLSISNPAGVHPPSALSSHNNRSFGYTEFRKGRAHRH